MIASLKHHVKKLKISKHPYTVIEAIVIAIVFIGVGIHLLHTSHAASAVPTVTITSPSSNSEIYGKAINVEATATANDGGSIVSSALQVNGVTVSTLTSSPYSFSLNTLSYPDGSYTLSVNSTDDQGNVGSASVAVNISNGDLNLDGAVNVSDLAIMASNWGKTGQTYAQGAINGPGTVNIQDLAILAANWGWTGGETSANNSGFVTVCGIQLCLNGKVFEIHGATAYGQYSNAAAEISLAQQGNLNVLELVEFDTQYHVLSDTMSLATWTRLDSFIAAAKSAGLHVILNLSEYGQSLQAAGQTPTTTDWESYLSFIANRTNTITGVQYKNDPTIAMVEIFGEICYPGESDSTCPSGTTGTTADMQSFFDRTETEWHALAPNILISSGGFSHLDSTDNPTGTSNGIPYQTIYSDPANSVCDLEVNSTNDYSKSIPKATSYCKQINKPWFLSAWSSCYQDTGYPYYLATDAAMASHAQDMYNIQNGQSPSNEVGVGSDFWNLANTGVSVGHCDLSPAYPTTWSTIQNNT